MTDAKTQVLTDKSATGKDRPWKVHKIMNELLAMVYDDLNPSKAERLRTCATELTFAVSDEGKRLISSWFCRVRLCPMCSWRRSLKVGAQMTSIMAEIAKGEQPYRYLMLTLTMKNVAGEGLKDGLDHLMRSFDRMFRRRRVKDVVKGWYRAVEITHNLDTNEYHPHIHCVLAVMPGYFSGGRYIKHGEWMEFWRESAKLDYDPTVDVRTIKGNTAAAVAEVAKYAVKSGDYIIPEDWDLTLETVQLLDSVLAGRRFIGFGGIFKEIQRKLKLADPEDEGADLVHIDGEAPSGAGERTVTYVWYSGYRQYIRADTQ